LLAPAIDRLQNTFLSRFRGLPYWWRNPAQKQSQENIPQLQEQPDHALEKPIMASATVHPSYEIHAGCSECMEKSPGWSIPLFYRSDESPFWLYGMVVVSSKPVGFPHRKKQKANRGLPGQCGMAALCERQKVLFGNYSFRQLKY